MGAGRFRDLQASIPDPGPILPPPAQVVEGRFNGPLKVAAKADAEPAVVALLTVVPAEFLRNLDTAIGRAPRREGDR